MSLGLQKNGLQSYCILTAPCTHTIWVKLSVNKAELFDLMKIDSAVTVAVDFAAAFQCECKRIYILYS